MSKKSQKEIEIVSVFSGADHQQVQRRRAPEARAAGLDAVLGHRRRPPDPPQLVPGRPAAHSGHRWIGRQRRRLDHGDRQLRVRLEDRRPEAGTQRQLHLRGGKFCRTGAAFAHAEGQGYEFESRLGFGINGTAPPEHKSFQRLRTTRCFESFTLDLHHHVTFYPLALSTVILALHCINLALLLRT